MTLAQYCQSLPKTSRRIMALLIVPVILIAVLLAVCLPAAYLHDAQVAWREEAGSLLARSKTIDAARDQLDAQLAGLQAAPVWSKFYPSSPLTGGATALQADVSAFFSNAQVSGQTLTPLASASMPHFTKIGTRVTASMRIDQLRSLLAAVVAHQRYLRLEQVTIVAPQNQLPEENPPLAVTLEIYGYELQGAPQATLAMRAVD